MIKAEEEQEEQKLQAEEKALKIEEEAEASALADALERAEEAEQLLEACNANLSTLKEQDGAKSDKVEELQNESKDAEKKLDAYKVLVGAGSTPAAVRVPPTAAPGTTCDLAMFKSVKYPGKGIYHENSEGKLEAIKKHPQPKSFWFYILNCEKDLGNCGSGDHCVSLESHNSPGYFLRHQVLLVRWEDENMYQEAVSFCMKPALSGGQNEVSFESVNGFSNTFVSSEDGLDLKILHIDSLSDDQDVKDMASYKIKYLPCDSRRHLRRNRRSNIAATPAWQ